jgi:hypothetical protein
LKVQLENCLITIPKTPIDPLIWEAGRYKPTPTIVEAAQALYRGHDVMKYTLRAELNLSETPMQLIELSNHKTLTKGYLFYYSVPDRKTLAG